MSKIKESDWGIYLALIIFMGVVIFSSIATMKWEVGVTLIPLMVFLILISLKGITKTEARVIEGK